MPLLFRTLHANGGVFAQICRLRLIYSSSHFFFARSLSMISL